MTDKPVMPSKLERWPIERLVPYERNARTHSPEQVAQIAASIQEFGFTNPILVDGKDEIIAGHGRLLAAKDLSLVEVPVVVLDHLTPDQKRAYVLADNKLALNAGWDDELLRMELVDLDQKGFDLSLVGWSEDELTELMPEVQELHSEDFDENAVPEAPADPITKPGDLWILGNHRLLCGDSTNIQHVERLMDGKKADACVTSPPYGVNLSYSSYEDSFKQTLQLIRDVIPVIALHVRDYAVINFADIVSGSKIVGTDGPCQYLMGQNYFDAFRSIGWVLWSQRIWKKPHAKVSAPWTCNSNRAACDWEHIFTFASPKPSFNERCNGSHFGVLDSAESGESKVLDKHPGAFPVFIPETLIPIHAKPGAIIFEPFGGTGTTLIACERQHRHARLMELDPAYCDVIVKRWEDFTGKTATLEATGEAFPSDT